MEKKMRKLIFLLPGILIIIILAGAAYILRNRRLEEEAIKKQIDKYNKYADFYNKANSGILGDFEVFYMNNFADKRKNFKKPARINLIEINSIRQRILTTDEDIQKIEKVLNEKPEFKNIDSYIKEYINAIKEEKDIVLAIIEYYETGSYETDGYQGGTLLHALYLNSIRKSNERYVVYVEIMKNLIRNEKQKEITRLEKKGRKAAVNMVHFINSIEDFSQLLYSRMQFDFNKDEIEVLKRLKDNMKERHEGLKAISERQIENDRYRIEDYEKIRSHSEEIVGITEALIERLEKDEELFPLPYNFSTKHSEIISEYNSMIGNKK